MQTLKVLKNAEGQEDLEIISYQCPNCENHLSYEDMLSIGAIDNDTINCIECDTIMKPIYGNSNL